MSSTTNTQDRSPASGADEIVGERYGKIAYVSHYFPYGTSETFIWPEVAEHRLSGTNVILAPIRSGPSFHRVDPDTLPSALFSSSVFFATMSVLFRQPGLFFRTLARVTKAPPAIAARNLAVFPKGLWLGRRFAEAGVEHIHAHWLSTPASAAMIASGVSGIPYSVTAHRIDISQGNLIPEKLASARFVRAIDRKGRDEIAAAAPEYDRKAQVVYLGAAIPSRRSPLRDGALQELRVVTAARLVEKKGHQYLVEAIALARSRGVVVRADLYGDGPLQSGLEARVAELGLGDQVRFCGPARHETLLEQLVTGAYDASVLPSVTAADGDREGIPAFLMESMAAGVPVITTDNGGVCELVRDGEGIVISERDSEALADALVRMAAEPDLRRSLADGGRQRMVSGFDVKASADRLRGMMSNGLDAFA